MEGTLFRQSHRLDPHDGLASRSLPVAVALEGNDFKPGLCEIVRDPFHA